MARVKLEAVNWFIKAKMPFPTKPTIAPRIAPTTIKPKLYHNKLPSHSLLPPFLTEGIKVRSTGKKQGVTTIEKPTANAIKRAIPAPGIPPIAVAVVPLIMV